MRTIALFSFILFVNASLFGQKAAKSELVWHTDLTKAIDVANKEDKPLMLFFTGSDWCGWCMKLQKEVFTQSEFKNWAQNNVVLVEVDFPRANIQSEEIKTQNRMLQQQFAVRGYPTCWFVKADKLKDGKVNFTQLGSKGYEAGGPVNWTNGAQMIINPN